MEILPHRLGIGLNASLFLEIERQKRRRPVRGRDPVCVGIILNDPQKFGFPGLGDRWLTTGCGPSRDRG